MVDVTASEPGAVAARVTLVTGATRGIGRAIAEKLAAQNHRIVGIARRTGDGGFPGEVFLADMRNAEALGQALAAITARHEVTGLINSAGLNHLQDLGEIDLACFDDVIAVNLRAAIQCAQAVLPGMSRARFGRIVNIASRAVQGRAGASSYAAAKAGLVAVTRSWALELADRSITVNAVAPGPTATAMWDTNNPSDSPATRAQVARIPMGRLGRPDEVAGAVSYFMSEEAGFVTGQCLYVCGGLSIGWAMG
jgi:NAD(P)-dependent dehydrogenase (short-subunit alcohol dehydrogenase family)